MNINELKTSNFLKRSDVGDGTIVTIKEIDRQNVAKEGAPEEMKYCLHFEEFDKPMVLNSTCGQLIAHALKSEESDDWIGQQVILFDDPSVSFGGKLVGGIRVRALPKPAATDPAPAGGKKPSAVHQLKAKFVAHPEMGKSLTKEQVNDYMIRNFDVKLDGLTEGQAQNALDNFDRIVMDCIDNAQF